MPKSKKPVHLFDMLRAAKPKTGFAIYAYNPGEDMIVEMHEPNGDIFTVRAKNMDEATAKLLPLTSYLFG